MYLDFNVFFVLTKGQILQFVLHLCIPGIILLGLFEIGGSLALISLSLILCGLEYATRGGLGKTAAM